MAKRVDLLAGGNLMSLNLKERKAAVREVSKRYKKVHKKEKGKYWMSLLNSPATQGVMARIS